MLKSTMTPYEADAAYKALPKSSLCKRLPNKYKLRKLLVSSFGMDLLFVFLIFGSQGTNTQPQMIIFALAFIVLGALSVFLILAVSRTFTINALTKSSEGRKKLLELAGELEKHVNKGELKKAIAVEAKMLEIAPELPQP
jgi:hypothetical protein